MDKRSLKTNTFWKQSDDQYHIFPLQSRREETFQVLFIIYLQSWKQYQVLKTVPGAQSI